VSLERRLSVHPEAGPGAPLVVLLHGRGADETDLAGLAPSLPMPAIAVFPRAPFPSAPWGYGPGWAWYRFIGGARPDPETFEEGQRALAGFLDGLVSTLPIQPGPMVLGGFSQGGTMALGYALRNPGRVAAVLNFSGFLPEHPSVRATRETVAGTAFFWGHGSEDASIPLAVAEPGRAALRRAGARLTAPTYRMGHGIGPDELREAMGWLAAVGLADRRADGR
jgi:phospholipase/carboxylesterase